MTKRIFRYDKWKDDEKVIEILDSYNDPEFKDFMHKRMKSIDGKVVKFKTGTSMIKLKDAFGWDSIVVPEWTDPVDDKAPFWFNAIMVAGGLFAIYGLAVFGKNLADLLCSIV